MRAGLVIRCRHAKQAGLGLVGGAAASRPRAAKQMTPICMSSSGKQVAYRFVSCRAPQRLERLCNTEYSCSRSGDVQLRSASHSRFARDVPSTSGGQSKRSNWKPCVVDPDNHGQEGLAKDRSVAIVSKLEEYSTRKTSPQSGRGSHLGRGGRGRLGGGPGQGGR
ncbi:hypothetical protein GGI35DRAFT_451697 [Trichoderma velutinum]